jgi:hypothetical protein
MNAGEEYYTIAIRSNDPDRYVPPSWKIIARPEALKARIRSLEARENITATTVYDDSGKKLKEEQWRL